MMSVPKMISIFIVLWLFASALVLFFHMIDMPFLSALSGVAAIPATIIAFAKMCE